ncbi:MAG: RtcB family protein [Candidatus Paceibacterota bacterium]
MHEIKVKYIGSDLKTGKKCEIHNSALIMGEYPEEETVKQIYGFLNHPAFAGSQIRIMADHHAGSGSCIGFTMTQNNYVIPNVVGVDIGCGMLATNLGKISANFQELDNFIRENIPLGFSVRSKESRTLKNFRDDVDRFIEVASRINIDTNRVILGLGSLGGGNHFAELDQAPNGDIWLVIHTGSRNFGKSICDYHQNRAKELMNEMFIGDAYKNLEFMPYDKGGSSYLNDMRIAQKYASLNRTIITHNIVTFLNVNINDQIESVHNYIGDDKIIRKGAISAYKEQEVIIPLNMRDGCIFGTGKGSDKWNNSAPHGAGRILSRKKAKETVDIEKYKETMQGVWSTSINESTLDESPFAYKDGEEIKNALSETVDIDFVTKPIYVIKDSKKEEEI